MNERIRNIVVVPFVFVLTSKFSNVFSLFYVCELQNVSSSPAVLLAHMPTYTYTCLKVKNGNKIKRFCKMHWEK